MIEIILNESRGVPTTSVAYQPETERYSTLGVLTQKFLQDIENKYAELHATAKEVETKTSQETKKKTKENQPPIAAPIKVEEIKKVEEVKPQAEATEKNSQEKKIRRKKTVEISEI